MSERFYYYQPTDCGRGRPTPCLDGGRVYDDERRERQLERTFGKEHRITDKDNYRENLWGAAENKKPVVMLFGRGSDTNSGVVIDALDRAKKQHGSKADFMYVDLDKVDPNSAIGKYARGHIGRDFGTPMTLVFTQKQGQGRTPVIPERPMHWQRGPLNEERLNRAIEEAVRIQNQREIKTGRERKPDAAPEPEKQKQKTKPEDVIAESLKPIKDQKPEDLFKGMSREERFAVIQDSIARVDALRNPRASAQIRSTIALGVFGLGTEAASQNKPDEAREFFLEGSEHVMSAGIFNKDIYNYPQFAQRLRDTMPGTAGDALIQKGKDNPRWMYPDAAKLEAATTREQKIELYTKAREAYRNFLTEQMKTPKRKAA